MLSTMVQPTVSANAIEGLYATGHWLYSQQRIEHARSVFRAMIHIAPDDERGWLALGACHETQDQHDVAYELYSAAIAMGSLAPRCEIARARILRRRGQEDDARDALDEAARMAEELRDDELSKIIAAERATP
jgi:tetratricopeptide (TPR) repeat protein